MSLEPKEKRERKIKERKDDAEAVKESYRKILKTPAMQELIKFSTEQSQTYLTQAMREVDRDRKATLVDAASGAMLILNHITEMSKPISGRRTQKGKPAQK